MHASLLRIAAATAACSLVTATIIFGTTPAMAAPPTPAFGAQIDAYATYDGQDTCDPTAKPGVVGVRDLLNQAYGSHSSGITRACDLGGTSEHKEGRALDYTLDVNNSSQNAIANDILNWLLATDTHGNAHANARRLGVMYITWNYNMWKSYAPSSGWQPRSCDGSASDCHTNHIHISFSWAGALKQTSWWSANGGDGVGVWRASTETFHLDNNRDGATDTWIVYGSSSDIPLTQTATARYPNRRGATVRRRPVAILVGVPSASTSPGSAWTPGGGGSPPQRRGAASTLRSGGRAPPSYATKSIVVLGGRAHLPLIERADDRRVRHCPWHPLCAARSSHGWWLRAAACPVCRDIEAEDQVGRGRRPQSESICTAPAWQRPCLAVGSLQFSKA